MQELAGSPVSQRMRVSFTQVIVRSRLSQAPTGASPDRPKAVDITCSSLTPSDQYAQADPGPLRSTFVTAADVAELLG